jgi:hypothetical protein
VVRSFSSPPRLGICWKTWRLCAVCYDSVRAAVSTMGWGCKLVLARGTIGGVVVSANTERGRWVEGEEANIGRRCDVMCFMGRFLSC